MTGHEKDQQKDGENGSKNEESGSQTTTVSASAQNDGTTTNGNNGVAPPANGVSLFVEILEKISNILTTMFTA